jgi:hypothetical protein
MYIFSLYVWKYCLVLKAILISISSRRSMQRCMLFCSLIKQACLVAAHACEIYVIYGNVHSRLYHFSLNENICLFYKTSLLACNCVQIWVGGWVDDNILWLSFAQKIAKKKWFFSDASDCFLFDRYSQPNCNELSAPTCTIARACCNIIWQGISFPLLLIRQARLKTT